MGDSCGETPSDEEIARWTFDEESSRSTSAAEPTTSSSTSSSTAPSTSAATVSKSAAAGALNDFQKDIRAKYESNANKNCAYVELQKLNPHIYKMDEDILYHIALGNKSHDLQKMFKDVQFVVMGGTPKRMEQFAYFVMSEIGYELQPGTILNDISKHSHRYAMFKVGPVLSVSHGMGMPSIGILLHELIKLMHHAGVRNPKFFRIGTCGGFGKKAGTVVVSEAVVNDCLESVYELPILGTMISFPAILDKQLANEIRSFASPQDDFESIVGKTYSTDSFYEGSGRADGAICEFSVKESDEYYDRLMRNGVVNVEMESLAFAALTCRAGIKSAVICVILSDRLETHQIKQTKAVLEEWQRRPQKLLVRYIKKSLSITKPKTTGALREEIYETATKPGAQYVPVASSTTAKSTETVTRCTPLCSKPFDGPMAKETPKAADPMAQTTPSTTTTTSKSTDETSSCRPILCGPRSSSSKTTKSTITASDCPISCAKALDGPTTLQRSTASQPTATSKPSTTPSSQKTPGTTKECLPCIGARESVKQYFSQERTRESWRACYKICGMDTEKSDSTVTSTPFKPTTARPTSSEPATSGPAAVGLATSTPGQCYCGPPGLGPVKSKTTSAAEIGKGTTTASGTYKASDFDSSGGKSSMSDESRRTFYLECAKLPSCDTGSKSGVTAKDETTSKSAKKLSFFTPKREMTKEGAQVVDTRPCCGKSEDIRSPRTCAEQQQYLEERKEQEIDHTVESKGTPQGRRVSQPKPVDDPTALGPCCTKDFVKKSPAPVDTTEVGPCCLGLKEEETSPDCLDRTSLTRDDHEGWHLHDTDADATKHEPDTSKDRPISRSTDDSPTSPRGIFKTLSCPISIRCKSKAAADDRSETTPEDDALVSSPETPHPRHTTQGSTFASTPMPKTDRMAIVTPPAGPVKTPDTPCCQLRNISAFITPTATVSQTPKGSCCVGYPTLESAQSATIAGLQQSAAVPDDANRYDESPSPCAACKKYQETKNQNRTGTPSDSQPEIIKCRHKFKRLKEECEGYD